MERNEPSKPAVCRTYLLEIPVSKNEVRLVGRGETDLERSDMVDEEEEEEEAEERDERRGGLGK